jgi:UDP-glucose 4-epimerase
MWKVSDQFSGKVVLVTGASGFIGTHLCRRLVACGASVHAVSRKPHPREMEHLQWWQADCSEIAGVRRIVECVRPDFVFHLASRVTGARKLDVVLPTFSDNLVSTVHLLTAVAETGCRRLVLASSSEEPTALDEGAFPCSPYAAAKKSSSMYGCMFHQLFQVPVVMPRIFMTYGPEQRDMEKLVPFVIRCLLLNQKPLLSSGRRLADWVYVDDVVEGLLRAAAIPGIEGNAFDLGSGVLVSIREIVEEIFDIIDSAAVPEFGTLPDRPFEQERKADTTFVSTRLEYWPQTSVRQGLEKTVAWYRQQLS